MRTSRREYCYSCASRGGDGYSRQTLVGTENGVKPLVTYWTCVEDGRLFVTYADGTPGEIADAEGFAAVTWARYVAGKPGVTELRQPDINEAGRAEATIALWSLYLGWNPDLQVPFIAYASGYLPRRLDDWARRTIKDTRFGTVKLAPPADSLDAVDEYGRPILDLLEADRLGASLRQGGGAAPDDRAAALRGVLGRAHSRLARQGRAVGLVGVEEATS